MISRRLGLDAVALAGGTVRALGDVSPPRFKHTARIDPGTLEPATRIASALAQAIVAAGPAPAELPRMSAAQVRAALLERGATRVDFDGLLALAWRLGIAVIPLPHLPPGVRKMDAAALRVNGRPAIVIARRNDSKAWLSFILAHELGHLLLGHVPENGAIVEGSLQDSASFDAESQLDAQEREANAFAHTVLGGEATDAAVMSWNPRAGMMELVDAAMVAAPKLQSTPGQLILRFAFLRQGWKEAALALRFLADDVDAQNALIARLAEEINTAQIGEDLQDFVEKVTGVAARAA
jgi:hypothetical protein